MIRTQLTRSFKPGRLKAASLYIVIVIALVIALLCEAMIAGAFYYRAYHAHRNRRDRLDNNMDSGINMLLADHLPVYYENHTMALFESAIDSIRLSKRFWGGFDIGVSEARIGRDSALAAVMIANQPDTAKLAMWLADEDRPLSVSGKTVIHGDVYLPKAGVRTAYIDNHGYEGDPTFITRTHRASGRDLPEADLSRLAKIDEYFTSGTPTAASYPDTEARSFERPVREYRLRERSTLASIRLHGNIILRCDSLLTIDSTAILEDVMIFAPSIVVRSGFRGRCQLFVRDSIRVGDRSAFAYPSLIALVRSTEVQVKKQGIIRMGSNCNIFGGIMAWEKTPGLTPPLVYLGKKTVVSGQIYTGLLGLSEDTKINGGVTCRRFYYQSAMSLYENYLIDAHIDAYALSPYYCFSPAFPHAGKQLKKIVRWLK